MTQRARGLRERYLADQNRPVQAYASATSAVPGGSLEFRVSVPGGGTCSVAVRRFGTPVPTRAVRFTGEAQSGPVYTAGLTWCNWDPSLVLDIPESWPPGLYLARFSVTTRGVSLRALGSRSAYVPFVVRAPWDRSAPTLVVLPFATYTAMNRWPVDGATGRSLEVGYTSDGRSAYTHRAPSVSFDRPYSGNGMPRRFADDAALAERLAAQGREADFATSNDLHSGIVDPRNYDRVLFSPRDRHWSQDMRDAVAKAATTGTDVRWPVAAPGPEAMVRFEPSPDGRPDRVLVSVPAVA
jgi:hypothetical protein